MDERHGEIRTGAGLEDSRVNQEFVDFLKKWSTPVLLVIAAVLLSFVVYQRVEQARIARVDEAFASLEGASSPASLTAIAQDYENVRGVGVLARLRAADLYLSALRRGVKVGAQVNAQGEVENEDDLLDEATRTMYQERAEGLFREVLEKARARPGWEIHEVNALFGLAAVAESRGDMDAARAHYEESTQVIERAGLAPLDEVARARIEELDTLEPPVLYEREELPELPWETASNAPPPAPTPPPAPAPDEPGRLEFLPPPPSSEASAGEEEPAPGDEGGGDAPGEDAGEGSGGADAPPPG